MAWSGPYSSTKRRSWVFVGRVVGGDVLGCGHREVEGGGGDDRRGGWGVAVGDDEADFGGVEVVVVAPETGGVELVRPGSAGGDRAERVEAGEDGVGGVDVAGGPDGHVGEVEEPDGGAGVHVDAWGDEIAVCVVHDDPLPRPEVGHLRGGCRR